MRTRSTLLLLAAVACASEKPTDTDPGDSLDTSGIVPCDDDDGCPDGLICGTDDVCELGDRDNSFDDATSMRFNEDLSGMIAPPGDVDFYSFETLSPGQWVTLSTVNERTTADDLDTVLRLYQANGLEHAVQDNYDVYRITGADSRVIAYLPTAGTFYASVEDVSTYYPELFPSARGGRDYTYDLQLTTFTGILTESSPNEVVLERGTQISTRAFLLASEGDTDELTLTVPFDGRVVQITGGSGAPGSDATLEVEIERDGVILGKQTDLTDSRYLQLFEGEEGDYTVRVRDAAGGGSPGHWGVIYLRTYDEDATVTFWGTQSYEDESEGNDTVADADALDTVDQTNNSGSAFRASYVQGLVDDEGDVDVFAFDAQRDEQLTARCYADRFGSLADLAFRVLDDEGTEITAVDDGTTYTAPEVYNLELGGAGTYHLEVRATNEATGPGAYYRCQLLRTTWDVAQ